MNTIDLINKLAVSHNITTGRAEMIISITVERLIEKLKKDGETKVENFGTFRIMRKKSEQNYMKMDEPVQLAKNVLAFEPDPAFIEGLNSK
jgi:nucleoid DNA-binding protein